MSKAVQVPRVRVERRRHARYVKAYRSRREEQPDLTFSDWQREAYDRQADHDLGPKVEPDGSE